MADRRNVLFICADDLNSWISPLGVYPNAHTPNIESLADLGVLFTHAYCTAPHCNPSRTSVFTGMRPTTTGVYHGEVLVTRPDLATLPEHFRAHGYRVFGAGKVFHGQYDYAGATKRLATNARWLDTHNLHHVWDEFHPCEDEPLPQVRPFNRFFDFASDEVPDWYCHFDWGPMTGPQAEALPDVRIVERVTEFLLRPHDRPFFCAVGLYRPHLPWYVPQRFFDLYPLEQIVVPDVSESELDGVPAIAREWALTPNDHERILAHRQWRHAVRGYLASISFCDAMIGRLMDALHAARRTGDTIVVLWGDNGFHLGEKLHWRKFTLWEEATRVALVVAAQGRCMPGHRFSHPVSLLDLYPTLVELVGLPRPAQLEGESLVPWLSPNPARRASLPISTWGAGNHSVRAESWRYTRYQDGCHELYDHARDPRERNNLAASPDHAGWIAELAPWLDRL